MRRTCVCCPQGILGVDSRHTEGCTVLKCHVSAKVRMHEMAAACNKRSTALLFDKLLTPEVESYEKRAQQQPCVH